MKKLLLAASCAALMSAAPAAAQTVKKLKVGVLTDMSGPYATVAGRGTVEAAQMAVDDFNASQSAVKAELVSADHQNKPDTASTIARKWFDVDGVDVVTELTTSAVALAVQTLAAEKDKAVLISGAGSSHLTGKACTRTSVHWTYDTYALSNSTARAVFAQGGKRWYFISVDYAFGHALQKDVTDSLNAVGGEVVGGVKHPLNTADFSSYLLQAQSSGAEIVGLANAGADMINTLKQANEFGIGSKGQKLASLLMYINDVHSLGLAHSKNTFLTTGFYWDRNEDTRAWSKRFHNRLKTMPNMAQAGLYSSVLHYLKAAAKADSRSGEAVTRSMRSFPVNDMFATNGTVREDGRMEHDMFLVRVKTPEESKYPWDYYEIVRTIPGSEAFRSMKDGDCPLVKK